MRSGVGVRLGLVGLVMLVLMVPVTMLRGLVAERQARAAEVATEIAEASSHAQRLLGPMLLVEYEERRLHVRTVTEAGVEREVSEVKTERRRELVLPDRLRVDNELQTERRGRSLFSTLLVHADTDLQAAFTLPSTPPPDTRPLRLWLVMGLGDNRGLGSLEVSVGGRTHAPQPGTGVGWLEQGVHVPLPLDLLQQRRLEVAANMTLSGTGSMHWLPAGSDTEVHAHGSWPHPGFTGDRLPVSPSVGADGFRAKWSVSRLASQAQQAIVRCGADAPHCPAALDASFGVRLVEPVDRYLMTERAMKYALLVLALVLGAVFVLEVTQRRPVHPVQYGLTGLALAMFFLLLLSLSEHIGFGAAYLVAAGASTALISAYLSALQQGRAGRWIVPLALGALYGLLYGLLQSEDYALLMGSIALFGLLAALMLATRHLDWSRVGATTP